MTKKLIPIQASDILSPSMIDMVNKYVRPAFEKGHGETSMESLVSKMLTDKAVLWIAVDNNKIIGAATTELLQYEGYMTVHLITIGSDNNIGFEDYHKFLEEYAEKVKARDIQFWGRLGWSRAINKVIGEKDRKYKEVYRVFSMEI